MALGDFFGNLLGSSASFQGSFGAVGIGLNALGSIEGAQIASKEAGIQGQISTQSNAIFADQEQANRLRQQQMYLNTQRQSLQNVRNFQRARAAGLTAAVSGGAQFGSGLAGAYGQQSGQAQTNMLGINQNYQIGSNLFGLSEDEAGNKMNIANLQTQLAGLQGQAAIWQGVSGAGGGLLQGAKAFGSLFGNG